MLRPTVVVLILLCATLAAAAQTATLEGRAVDERGALVPCTVAVRTSEGRMVTDHPSFRGGFRSTGTFEKEVPAGETTVTVSRGFDYVAVQRKVDLHPGERREMTFELRRRSPLHGEGWYAGDNHDHMIHGERKVAVDFAYAALAGRAAGLDYLALAQQWNLDRVTPEKLTRACRSASTLDFLLTWNLEAPKNYYLGDVSRCLGHGWTAGMRGRTPAGVDAISELLDLSAHDYESAKAPAPNFESHALIHSLGGVVSYSHPCRWWWGRWGGRGIYPVEEKKFVSNLAAELPFDTIAGPTYDTLDVMMQPDEREANACAESLWFLLLNHGYHIAASGSSDATFDNPGGGVPGRVRVYARVPGGFRLSKAASAIRAGRSFVTTGPLLVLEMNGHGSGDTIHLERESRVRVRIRAWASGTLGSHLSKVELVRNGEVVRSFDLEGGREEFETGFDVREGEEAWYIARCFGSAGQSAITNPVYFEPADAEAPMPATAEVAGTVRDRATGAPLDGAWEIVRMVGKTAATERAGRFHDGAFQLDVPATARLRVRAPGYTAMTKSIFLDSAPLLQRTFQLRAEDLTDWTTFQEMREALRDVKLEFLLEKEDR